jgi:PTH1 family peptidyl-tRNA hydrolase
MRLFVGLGNPGREYEGNRHNIGFMALDAIARAFRAPPFRRRFQGEATDVEIAGEKTLLLKPLTYMNESGRSVGEAARFLKIALGDILVFHDELDLAPGKLRLKTGGGAAGHNGLRSIAQHMGADFKRARMGIGHPGVKELVHSYVLNDFAKSEQSWVETLCDLCARNAALLIANDDAGFQNKIDLGMKAAGFGEVKRVGEK